MIRVLIIDDYELVRRGIKAILARDKTLEVVGEARDGLEALEQVRSLEPDIVLMDIQMPRLDGLIATKWIRDSGSTSHILIFALVREVRVIIHAMRNGASGFCNKNDNPEDLLQAIHNVCQGKRHISPTLLGCMTSAELQELEIPMSASE